MTGASRPTAESDRRSLLDEIPGLAGLANPHEIVVHGARVHNLRNVDVTLPRDRLVVITGPSGSGKSSLAFDTLYAEGQRRYVESLSAYARQFLDQLGRPDVERIDGLSPALSIEQRSVSRSPRSTVGTATEIADHLRLLFARAGEPHCFGCGLPISSQGPSQMIERIMALPEGTRVEILSPFVRGRRGAYKKELDAMRRRGFTRARIDGRTLELDATLKLDAKRRHDIEVVIDRVVVKPRARERVGESVRTALELADGLMVVHVLGDRDGEGATGEADWLFSRSNACAACGLSFPEIAPRLFSFNNPAGACPACDGLGVRHTYAPALVIPDTDAPLERCIEPWAHKRNARYYRQIVHDLARHFGVEADTPWRALPSDVQRQILEGTKAPVEFAVGTRPTRGGKARKTRVARPFAGVLDDLTRRGDAKFARYRTPSHCTECDGARLRVEARSVHVGGRAIHELLAMSIEALRAFFADVSFTTHTQREVAARIHAEISERLRFLSDVGLGYLSLDRPSASLSGGEAQRIRLATQIGSAMLGVLYILDEPSIGLHARDNARLLASLMTLRDRGNSVVVVEHDEATIRAADYVIDVGPHAGSRGGEIVACGRPEDIEAAPGSVTGDFLSRRRSIGVPAARREGSGAFISLTGCTGNNLRDVTLKLPLGVFNVVTGVSGSGKSTLINDTLHRALAARLHGASARPEAYAEMTGSEEIDKVIDVDQAPIGRTPRSNAATYTGVFGAIRTLFTRVPEARTRGYEAGRFSFNVAGGRCESCEGDGLIRVEMNFLPDHFVTCEVCHGRRYNRETLQIEYKGRSIADVLEMSVDEALGFMENVPAARRALQALSDVGLGYVKLGQPATTLSGGEAQRIKLAKELAKRSTGRTLYLLDEPTTGLHFADVEKLLELLQRLVELGNTVVVIEHHLDVIKCADHVIDLGPEGGSDGGEIVAQGTPEAVAAVSRSHTGRVLADVLG